MLASQGPKGVCSVTQPDERGGRGHREAMRIVLDLRLDSDLPVLIDQDLGLETYL